jgi:hypothetical protein
VQVIQDDQDGLLRGDPPQQLGDRIKYLPWIIPPLAGRSRLASGRNPGAYAGKLVHSRCRQIIKHRRLNGELADNFDKRLEGVSKIPGVRAKQHNGPILMAGCGQLGHEAGLAGSRFSTDKHELATAGHNQVPQLR